MSGKIWADVVQNQKNTMWWGRSSENKMNNKS